MASTINATTASGGGVITTADASGLLDLQSNGTTVASLSSAGLKISRVDASNEGGQLDLCRSTDNTSAWAVDVYGSTSTPSLRFVDNVASATRAEIDGSANFKFNSGYGSVATAYGCRAWVNFNGTGTVAVIASGNVSSVTDGGVGTYTINFASALVDNKYSIVICASNNGATVNVAMATGAGSSKSTTQSLITTYTVSQTATDPYEINVAVFR